jgi:hypothetical protein
VPDTNVRDQEQSGKLMLALSSSQFDPEPKLGLSIDILIPAAARPLRRRSSPAAPAQPFGT